ncbi:hypothetical protein CCUS01_14051 [Colletotrichum cuscutae]|uniref:Uncharacterized protein n=1 Tax=Colletotrichum cuscutae TaxID=1209917 RepID=A0AAI9YA86_9PEZI|nr:hypothetical protein CCUS01_14051 [Colletotrichum cuscutae]
MRTAIKRLKTLYSVISKYDNSIGLIYTSKFALKIGSINIRLLISTISLNLIIS